MYKGIKSCVTVTGLTSDMFPCTVGVRQGENLSPFLFALYLNDLEEFLSTYDVEGLTSLSYQLENKCNLYLRLFVLLYADDSILLSESPDIKSVPLVPIIFSIFPPSTVSMAIAERKVSNTLMFLPSLYFLE